jgi:raffinose/stachyose/melibiose transport system permease protein
MASSTQAIDRADARSIARRRRRIRRFGNLLLFLAPAMALYLVLVILPIVQAAYYSGFRWNGLEPLTDFVGFANFERAFSDKAFIAAISHNALLVVLALVVQTPLGLGLALLLDQRLRGRAMFRLIFFVPYVLSEAATGVIWTLILQPDGLADQTLRSTGLGSSSGLWLADRDIVLLTMFVVLTWKYFGFAVVLFLAGLQGIPRELVDAAAIDGAGRRQIVRHIQLPLLGPTIRLWMFLAIVGSLQLFDLIWIMTRGGPADASNTMATYLFDHGIHRHAVGYGSAISVILFGISLLASLAYQRLVIRRDTEGAITRLAG